MTKARQQRDPARPSPLAAAATRPTRNHQEENVTTTEKAMTGEADDVKTMSFVTKMIGHQRTMAAGLVEVTKGMEQVAAGYEALQLDVEQIRAEAFQSGREAAARDIRAVRDTRAADAYCKATGDCGLGDCRSDSVADSAFAEAATIAETGVTR